MAKREPRVTRDRIMDAALAVFAEQGYHRASIEEIAARAGLTKGAVYYWFTDKDDLARDLQRALWSEVALEAARVTDLAVGTVENLRRGFRVMVATLERQPAARFFLRDVWLVPALDQAGRGDQEQAVEHLRDLLERGIARGDVAPADSEVLARVIMGVFVEATLHILTGGDADATVAVVDRMLAAFSDREAMVAPVRS